MRQKPFNSDGRYRANQEIEVISEIAFNYIFKICIFLPRDLTLTMNKVNLNMVNTQLKTQDFFMASLKGEQKIQIEASMPRPNCST